jgi:hypothetical protein
VCPSEGHVEKHSYKRGYGHTPKSLPLKNSAAVCVLMQNRHSTDPKTALWTTYTFVYSIPRFTELVVVVVERRIVIIAGKNL